MLRFLFALPLLVALCGAASAQTQVRPCTTTLVNNVPGCDSVSQTAPLPIGSGFTQTARAADLAVSAVSSNVILGATNTTARVCNTGSVTGYAALGGSTVTVTTANGIPIFANSCINLNIGTNTYLAGITASSTTTFVTSIGSGVASLGGGGSAASGGPPGGASGTVQYNAAGAFGGISQLTTNGTTTLVGSTTLDASFNKYLLVQGGVIAMPNSSVYIGLSAAPNKWTDSTDANDTIVGRFAGLSLPANDLTFHTFIGMDAGRLVNASSATSAGSTVVGQKALTTATTADRSVSIGSKSGGNMIISKSDVFVGYAAAQFAVSANIGGRVYVGYNAGQYDAGDYNIMIGYTAGPQQVSPNDNPATGQKNIGIGGFTLNSLKSTSGSSGIQNIAIGYQALNVLTGGLGNVAIGYQAGQNTTGNLNVFIGNNAGTVNTSGAQNIYLGNNGGSTAPNSQSNTFIAGSGGSGGSDRIDNVYFGKGYADTAATSYTINGTGGSGSNNAAGGVVIAGGKGTGTGIGGDVAVQVAAAGSTGSAFNTLADAIRVKSTSSVVLGSAAIATNATDGFLYIVSGAGAPSGTPTAFTGRVALYYDSSNNQLYVYNSGWKQPKTPAAAAIVNWQ